MKFYCIGQFFIFLTVIWLIDAKSDEQSHIQKTDKDFSVNYHNYAKDQEITATELEPQASEVQHLEMRARRAKKKQRHIIHLKPQRKRGFVRYENPKKYYNKRNNNNNNNEHEEIIRTYEETHEHVEESSNVNENRPVEHYLNNGMEEQQQGKLIEQQQARHDQNLIMDTQMDSTQHHHHHVTHEEDEDEIKEEKHEKIKIKHHHHHHHHNHVKEIIKKIPEPYPVEKIVRVPIEKIVEKIVRVPKPYPVEKIVHVPVEKIIEKIVHVPKPYPVEKIVEKKVPYTVEKIIENIVHVPKPYPVEKVVNKVVHVPKPYAVIRPMPYAVPYKVEVEKKIPVPYRVEVEKKIPIYMQQQHSGHYEQQQEEHEREEHQNEQRHNEEEQQDHYGYGSDTRGQETIYGKPQTMSQIYAQLQEQNAQTKSAIRDILIKQQLKNLGYQKIPLEVQQESKNNYVMMAPQPSSFKIHVASEQNQEQKATDLQPQSSNIKYTQEQLQPLTTMPYQLFHIQAMPFQQPLGFSLPIKS